MEAKSRLMSKTNWAAAIIAIGGYFAAEADLFKTILGDHYNLVYVVIGIVMVALREVTKEPVK